MAVYLDTNLLVRLFADLPESEHVEGLIARLDPADGPLPITWLHRIELPNALQLTVLLSRSGRGARMTPETALLGLEKFEDELRQGRLFRSASLEMDSLVRDARELSLRHTARHGFRSYDVAHVASARLLGAKAFWSLDAKASQLAKLEGMKVI